MRVCACVRESALWGVINVSVAAHSAFTAYLIQVNYTWARPPDPKPTHTHTSTETEAREDTVHKDFITHVKAHTGASLAAQ